MKNRKLYAALLTGTLAVTMMGTTVFASAGQTGTTQFTYEGGTIQPPGTGDANDWMVKYPTSVKLADSNKAENAAGSKTTGVPMEFSVTKKDGSAVEEKNIGAAGLKITATANNWSGTTIKMNGGNGETVNMQLTSGVVANQTNFMQSSGVMATLTPGSAATTKATGYASLSSNSAPVSGQNYSQTVTWTVAKNS